MSRQIGLPLAAALKLLVIGAALVLDSTSTAIPAILLLPVMALVVGLTLARGSRRLAAMAAAAAAAVYAIGFPIVLWVIHYYRFGAGPDFGHMAALVALLAIPGLVFAPLAAWLLARKGSSKLSDRIA